MKYAVLGASGQLGRDLCPLLDGDVTPLARAIQTAVQEGAALPSVLEEKVYEVEEGLRRQLGIT